MKKLNAKSCVLWVFVTLFAMAVSASATVLFQDDFNVADGPISTQDPNWVVEPTTNSTPPPVNIVDGKLDVYGDWTDGWTTIVGVQPTIVNVADVSVSVDVSGGQAMYLCLRYQNNGNYLRINYNPWWNPGPVGGPGIYFNEYAGWIYGSDNYDGTATPDLGSSFTMSATLAGTVCNVTVSDGTNTYAASHTLTTPVCAWLMNPGTVAVGTAGGDIYFDNVVVSTVPEPASCLVLLSGLVTVAAGFRRVRTRQ